MIGKWGRYARVVYEWKVRRSFHVSTVPEEISIELTNECNFKCSYCPHSDPGHFDMVGHATIKPEQVDLLLSKLRKAGIATKTIHWGLDGEPFINRRIGDICRVAIGHGWQKFIFATNGYFCSLERIKEMPFSGNAVSYLFTVDFCSDRKYFERHRGGEGSWDVIRGNILRILEADLPQVSFVLTDISSYQVSDREEQRQRYEALQKLFANSPRLGFKTRVFHDTSAYVSGNERDGLADRGRYHLCPYPWTTLTIAANGDVVSCDRDLQHKNVLGNLFHDDVLSIWNGEKYQAFRKALVKGSPGEIAGCRGCDLPYDDGKFSASHLYRIALVRLGLFDFFA
jgi:radical SAM protein with 4Fe4S-binding SPASM domain